MGPFANVPVDGRDAAPGRSSGLLRPALAAAAAGWLLAHGPLAPVPAVAQQPVFRAATDAVMVTATVIDKDGRLVTDLTKDDFEIKDNGDVRPITVFRNDVVPFSVVVMFDISGSMLQNMSLMRRGVTELVGRFQPGDRANIGTFTGLPAVGPRFTANPRTLVGWVNGTINGAAVPCTRQWADNPRLMMAASPQRTGTAVWAGIDCGIDTVAADGETPRRVVMVITDGMDNTSAIGPVEVLGHANDAGVMVYAVGMFGSEGLGGDALRTLAEQTGGGYFQLVDRDDLPATFARVADELRHQYIFGFAPTSSGIARHAVDVVARRPGLTTRARRVYTETVPAVAARATALAAPPSSGPPSEIAAIGKRPAATSLLDQYDRGGGRSTGAVRLKAEDLWAVVGDLRKSAPAWIRARGPADEARRRLAVATYVLELVNAQDEFVWQPPLSVSDVLEWAGGVLRDGSAFPAERVWYLAAVSLLERLQPLASVDVDPLVPLLSHAERRFPDEPRWALVRAISEELHTWPERRDDGTSSVAAGLASRASRLTSRFREAAAREPTRQEAQLRWGYVELRRGQLDDALSHFDLAGTPDDVWLRYWLHLFKGRALEQKNLPADALTAYRLAFEDVPYAQSATVSLGAALVAEHRPTEAAALITRMLPMRPAPLDPWTLYTCPDVRFWPQLLAALQKAIVP